MSILESVKASQRVVNDKVNGEYQEMIDACKNELIRLGISAEKVIAEDTEVTQACKLYVHWMTDYEGKGSQWGVMYANYVNALSLHVEYREECDV